MSGQPVGVYFDRGRQRWMYQPSPFTAEDCESIAYGLDHRDAWARDLLAAAERIRTLDAET